MAHIGAVVGSAGVNLAGARAHDYGVDGTLRAVGIRGKRRVETGFSLDFQAKATRKWAHEKQDVVYDLESKTYNDLVSRDPELPRCFLVLLCLPPDQPDWLIAGEKELILRNCCYWTFVSGAPTGNEKSRVRIRIPRSQLFTPSAIDSILLDERTRILGGP